MSQAFFTVVVHIIEAKSLAAEDGIFSGKSDPYAIIKLKGTSSPVYRTKTIKETINPIWDEVFVVDIPTSGDRTLRFDLYDKDVDPDDALGTVEIDLSTLSPNKKLDEWYDVQDGKGKIHLVLNVLPLSKSTAPAPENTFATPSGLPLNVAMGPVLIFHGIDNQNKLYKVAINSVIEGNSEDGQNLLITMSPPPANGIRPTKLKSLNNLHLWRYSFEVNLTDQAQTILYSIATTEGERKHSFTVPASGASPKFTYVSCNGFHDDKERSALISKTPEFNLWIEMRRRHQVEQYNLVIQGGDQAYADRFWEQLPGFVEFNRKTLSSKVTAPFTEEMAKSLEQFYFNLFTKHWNSPDLRQVLAEIPSVMMWDDHDIFDGYGSYEKDIQQSPVYLGIFKEARNAFLSFQLALLPNEPHPSALPGSSTRNFSQVYDFGQVALAALDHRSERSLKQVMSDQSHTDVENWLKTLKSVKHLIVLSAVPVVYHDFLAIESGLELLPGQQELEDDFQDHWNTSGHATERKRFVQYFFDFNQRNNARTTILSGDVHVACYSVIARKKDSSHNNNGWVINNLISSPVTNQVQSDLNLQILNKFGDRVYTVSDKVKGQCVLFPNGEEKRYIGGRNFLSGMFDEEEGLVARWFVEKIGGSPSIYNTYIHPFAEGRHQDVAIIE